MNHSVKTTRKWYLYGRAIDTFSWGLDEIIWIYIHFLNFYVFKLYSSPSLPCSFTYTSMSSLSFVFTSILIISFSLPLSPLFFYLHINNQLHPLFLSHLHQHSASLSLLCFFSSIPVINLSLLLLLNNARN